MMYGSTVNGLMAFDELSDLDLTILIDDFEIHHDTLLKDITKVIRDEQPKYTKLDHENRKVL